MVVTSKSCTLNDLEKNRDSWLRVHLPMANRELQLYFDEWLDSFEKLPYLKVVKTSCGYGKDILVAYRCVCKLPINQFDVVKADLERLWLKIAGDRMESLYCFKSGVNRIDFHFVGLTGRQTVFSGCIVVEPIAKT